MDSAKPTIFSLTPNFIQPMCSGFCPPGLSSETIFSMPDLLLDIFSGLILSGFLFLMIKAYRKSTTSRQVDVV